MEFIADLHIHGKYSRACSKELTIPNLEKWAKIKGITLLGTGDFTHPKWAEHIREELKEDGTGFLRTKAGFPFILQTEISLIYSQGGKGRRVHVLIYAPSLAIAGKITEALKTKGRVDYDGRPIFNITCREIVGMMRNISEDIEVIPAHCLPPEEPVICNNSLKQISELNIGDNVLTHKGRFKNVTKIYKRKYSGELYHIIPWKLSSGTKTTGEHPFYCYKSYKCPWTKAVCKPTCHVKNCKNWRYLEYKAAWVPARELKVRDILLYPIIQKIEDGKEIRLKDYLKKRSYEKGQRVKDSTIIRISLDFCRLIGYYLAEGYTNNRDAITFTFHKGEKEYINDVVNIMGTIFGIKSKIRKSAGNTTDLVFYSKNLHEFFSNFCYEGAKRNACTKRIPPELLYLPLKKQVELLKGWWYGAAGYTSSLTLATQMKSICLRLGILPSFRADDLSKYNKKIGDRKIYATAKSYSLGRLTFFEDKFKLLNDSAFQKFKSKTTARHGWIEKGYVYLPIREIKLQNYNGDVYNLEVEEDNSYVSQAAIIHNCWTPWFAVFGSNSGFDSLEEAFGDNVNYIHAVESGISSDPAMNWRLSKLDRINIVSFSDLHSFWPWRLGREATIFEIEPNYKSFLHALRAGEGIKATIEADPAYGKYHVDGHKNCNVRLEPKEAIKLNNICPVCKSPLTIGVLHRVEELADREENYTRKNAPKTYHLIPLSEIIATVLQKGIATRAVWDAYNPLIENFGNELNVLMNASYDELKQVCDERIAELIIKLRERKVKINPGYDGVYGNIRGYANPEAEEEPKVKKDTPQKAAKKAVHKKSNKNISSSNKNNEKQKGLSEF